MSKHVDSKVVEVAFNAVIPETFVEEFGKIIDHKMDCLLNLDEFPEIGSIYYTRMKVIGDNYPSEVWKNHTSCVVTFKFNNENEVYSEYEMRNVYKKLYTHFRIHVEASKDAEFQFWFDYEKYQIHVLNREDTTGFKENINQILVDTIQNYRYESIYVDAIVEYSDNSKFFVTTYDDKVTIIPYDYSTIKTLNEYEPWYEAK